MQRAPRRARLARPMVTDGASDEWHAATLRVACGTSHSVVDPIAPIGGALYRLSVADARIHLGRGISQFAGASVVPWSPLRDATGVTRPLFVGPYDPLIEELAALAGFRCRWTADESGAALDHDLTDAAGVIVRGPSDEELRARRARGQGVLVIGERSEGTAYAGTPPRDAISAPASAPPSAEGLDADPWERVAAVAAGTMPSARTTRFIAERFGVRFEERDPSLYAVVWEESSARRFSWGAALRAAMGAVGGAGEALGYKRIGAAVGEI